MPEHDTLAAIFLALERWRHLPTYQLERRLDVFIAPYLLDFLRASGLPGIADVDWLPDVLPEFPLPVTTLVRQGFGRRPSAAGGPPSRSLDWPAVAHALEMSVDYAVFARARPTILLVELKTDAASIVPTQVEYLLAARRCAVADVIEGLEPILLRTEARLRPKYDRLTLELQRLGAIAPLELDAPGHDVGPLDAPLSHREKAERTRRYRVRVDALQPTSRYAGFEIVYLLPTRSAVLAEAGIAQIPFDEVSALALKPAIDRGDPVARGLLELLPRLRTPAGHA